MAATRVPAKGVDEVFYPGALEAGNEAQPAGWHPVSRRTLADLKRIAMEMRLRAQIPFQ